MTAQEKAKLTKQLKKISRTTKEIKVYSIKMSVKGSRLKYLENVLYDCKVAANSYLLNPFQQSMRKSEYFIETKNDVFLEWDIKTEKKEHSIVVSSYRIPSYYWTYADLPYRCKSAILAKIKGNIMALSALKKKGSKVGRIKRFKRWNIIPLEVFGQSFRFENKHVKIERYNKLIRLIGGTSQLPDDAEITSGEIIRKDSGFYLNVCFYTEKEKRELSGEIGIDFGVKTSITLSDGRKFDLRFNDNKNLRLLQRKLRNKKLHSGKYKKVQDKVRKLYQSLKNKRTNALNQLVHDLTSKYETIVIQDDSFKGWQMSIFGKQISDGCLGKFKSELKRKANKLIVVKKFFPSSKLCSNCGQLKKIGLDERIYVCDCGFMLDRDVNAAINILKEGLSSIVKN